MPMPRRARRRRNWTNIAPGSSRNSGCHSSATCICFRAVIESRGVVETTEGKMGLFDNINANLDAIAGKVGMTPDQVSAITNTLQSKMTEVGGNQLAALEATAAQHGVPVDKLQAIMTHGSLADQAGGLI